MSLVRGDTYDMLAWCGGAGAAMLGFVVGACCGGVPSAVMNMMMGIAVGYSVHALRLLEWYVSRAGWSLSDVLALRWDLAQMEQAYSIGFGNLGNNGLLAAIVLPGLVVTAVRSRVVWQRVLLATAVLLAMAVLAVMQSRGPLLVAVPVTCLLLYCVRARVGLALAVIAVAAVAVGGISADGGREQNAVRRAVVTLQRLDQDNSVLERREAIAEGWDVATASPLMGVGPSGVFTSMTYTAPHQWHLHQALEWGMVVAVLLFGGSVGLAALFARLLYRGRAGSVLDQDLAVCMSVPATYFAVATGNGAQWHFGLAGAWPILCGLAFGVAWSVRKGGSPRTMRPRT